MSVTEHTLAARARREATLLKACRLDVVAFKPGNVSLCSPGHGMQAADFLASARIAVPWLCAEQLGVGQRMQLAMLATMAAVGCNTNLGIVLLLAPLAAAVGEGAEVLQQGHAPKATLRRGLVPVQPPAGVQHALQSVH